MVQVFLCKQNGKMIAITTGHFKSGKSQGDAVDVCRKVADGQDITTFSLQELRDFYGRFAGMARDNADEYKKPFDVLKKNYGAIMLGTKIAELTKAGIPVLFAGDFNNSHDSPCKSYDKVFQANKNNGGRKLTNGYESIDSGLKNAYTTWKQRIAGDQPKIEPTLQGVVEDYLLLTEGLTISSVLSIVHPRVDKELEEDGLVNYRYPSDHFAIGGVIDFAEGGAQIQYHVKQEGGEPAPIEHRVSLGGAEPAPAPVVSQDKIFAEELMSRKSCLGRLTRKNPIKERWLVDPDTDSIFYMQETTKLKGHTDAEPIFGYNGQNQRVWVSRSFQKEIKLNDKGELFVHFKIKGGGRFRNRYFEANRKTYNFLKKVEGALKTDRYDERRSWNASGHIAERNLACFFRNYEVDGNGRIQKTNMRRRMAQREFSSRRDSPVMARLLEQIVHANQEHDELN